LTILIADSGSTKCDWLAITESGSELGEFHTMGFNPYFHDADLVEREMLANAQAKSMANQVDKVYFYGAGSSSPALCAVIQEGLQRVFTQADVHVGHDLDGAAYSTYTGETAVTCILGTGSNSCRFDGNAVTEEVPALAYILGDEGSGTWFGKKLLTAFLYRTLPQSVHADFERQYGMDKLEIIRRVYQEPNANVFLASFMTFLGKHRDHPTIQAWLDEGFKAFLDVHVACYADALQIPIHFVGSVAYHFQEELKKACHDRGYTVGNIIKKPIDGLARYHVEFILNETH
jgi:N-acetylglucosamine kinase-like BadF-type ATPase